MKFTVFDIETNGLLDKLTKIHCLCYSIIDSETRQVVSKGSITDYNQMINFLKQQEILIGHNIVRFDIPALEKVLNIKVTSTLYDTLALSWYLYPFETKGGKVKVRQKHGLEQWGEELGVKKPEILDWENLSVEEYIHRCSEDVEINTLLWFKMEDYLKKIYLDLGYTRLIGYLTFKMDCLREQEQEKCYIDVKACHTHLATIMTEIEKKTEQLISVMPKKIIYKEVKKPKIMYKKDGTLSSNGLKFIELCKEYGHDPETIESFKIPISEQDGNPGSPDQLKAWLFSLGWEPTIVEETTSKVTGITKEIPKVSKGGRLCEDIYRLIQDYPELENLKGLTILKHRKGVFEGFIEAAKNTNMVEASANGFTNTLRFKHVKPIANLTKVEKPWGKEIRSVITVPNDNYTLCGADMSALEDTTKQHYMYYYDPEYVKAMRVPGFDPHVDIAIVAGLMTKEEGDTFKKLKNKVENLKQELTQDESDLFHKLSKARSKAKTVNFAGVYGAGPPKIAKTLKCDINFAKSLHTAYWERNKAVKLIAKDIYYKEVDGQMWLYNPVSHLYYTLREEKDIFSTLNQGTGVYCFDSWLRKVRAKGVKMFLQYHDEKGSRLLKGQEKEREKILRDSITELNNELKLNVPLGISVAFGNNYAQIH